MVTFLIALTKSCVMSRRYNIAPKTPTTCDCWRLRGHILRRQKNVASFHKHSDFWMLRFFKLRRNRRDEVKCTLKFGPPRVDAR